MSQLDRLFGWGRLNLQEILDRQFAMSAKNLGNRQLDVAGIQVEGNDNWLTLERWQASGGICVEVYGNFLKAFFTWSSGKARRLIIFTASTERELSSMLRATSSLGTSRISTAS